MVAGPGRTRAGTAAAVLAALVLPHTASAATWYAGDGHVHTCYSHDAYCGPEDDNTGPETFYSSAGTVAQRFTEASAKRLDFLIISDHDDVRAQADPAYASQGVAGLPAYEASISGGHAHMLGATRLYPEGDTSSTAGTTTLANTLRADGGRFQANHPSYTQAAAFESCDQADNADPDAIPLHWKYGFSVQPDTIEVWNATSLLQPAEIYWECWLQRGVRVAGVAGSDSHGATQPTLGLPTTWVLADSLEPRDLLAAMAAGRTTLSRNPPALGGVRLVIEADPDRDGRYELAIGDQVQAGTPLRVRADGGASPGFLRVRANGATVVDGELLKPGGTVQLAAPATGWVRATLYLLDGTQAVDPGCRPIDQPFDTCSRDLAIAAMTSPVYVGAAPTPEPETPGPQSPPDPSFYADEPDDNPPLPAVQQSNSAAPLPDIPIQRTRGSALSDLRAPAHPRCGTRRRTTRLRVTWTSADRPVQLQLRTPGRWRAVRASATSATVRAPCRSVTRLRARARPAGLAPGPWKRLTVPVR